MSLRKRFNYFGCEITFNPANNEYSAFDEDGEKGGFYLGGGDGETGLKVAKKEIEKYLNWKQSFCDAVQSM